MFCLYDPFNCISFHKSSWQLSVFSLCSSGPTYYWSFQLHVSFWKFPPFYSVLVSISVFMALLTVSHSIILPDNSPFSHSVLPVLCLPYWSFQLYISFWKSPSALILLVSWCFEPSQPQRITSGLNTNFTLSLSYSLHKSHTTSHVFWAYLYSAGTQHGNLHQAGWPILFCGPTQEPVLATANTWKNRERFWKKMQVNGPER